MIAYICDRCGKLLKGSYYQVLSNYITYADRNCIERLVDCLKGNKAEYKWHLCDECMKEIAKQCKATKQMSYVEEAETEEESDEE